MHRGLSPSSSEISWQTALRQVLEVTHEPLSHAKVGWAVIGSAASTLQGCRLPPADIDILFAEPEGVHQFAQFMSVFAVRLEPAREYVADIPRTRLIRLLKPVQEWRFSM